MLEVWSSLQELVLSVEEHFFLYEDMGSLRRSDPHRSSKDPNQYCIQNLS